MKCENGIGSIVNSGDVMTRWRKTELGEVITLKRGYDLPQQKRVPGNVPIFSSSGISGYHNLAMVQKPGVITGRYGTIGQVFFANEDFWPLNTTLYVQDFHGNDPLFIYYFLKTLEWEKFTSASAVPGINRNVVHKEMVTIPDLKTQQKIAGILMTLDNKIALNDKINANLQQQAQAIFKSWFVDFEPFQNGEFVESELGPIPKGWRVGSVADIVNIHDSKRIPLSGAQRQRMEKKIYPYYGAASLMDYVENYIFDGIYLLLGEDGTVMDDKGYPILQYVWGKFWVNNHAHVLTGKCGYSVESLYLLFLNTPVKSIVTGAVQAKISQSNLKAIQIIVPPQEVLDRFNELIQPYFSMIRQKGEENKRLENLRDTLLPKLMNGEIDIIKD